ncbi:unnamed protein product [Knipowitschia caucasica]|uniref:Coiled-coil domain-containing protein 172 n=1 Tax=Knipowitschia caucasica TaxID=637954 RepID=A0AAV2LKV2_KNICA
MSLDTLFQQILLTEQQLTEQTHKFKQVKVANIKCHEKIRATEEKCGEAKQELEETAQKVCATMLQCDLLHRTEKQMSTQTEQLLSTKEKRMERLASLQHQAAQEQEQFLEEICSFNHDMSLQERPKDVLQDQELLRELLRAEKRLTAEMEYMRHCSRHVKRVQDEQRALGLELWRLHSISREMDKQLGEAQQVTGALRVQMAEMVQKAVTDPACVQMRSELAAYKGGELELLREALYSEMLFLQSQLQD